MRSLTFVMLIGCGSVLSLPVWADIAPSAITTAAGASSLQPTSQAHAPASHEHGHAQGDKLGFLGLKRYDLGIYTLVVFTLLVLIINKYAWPHIRAGLEKREANIRAALAEAQKERDEARALVAQAKKQLEEAALQVRAMLDEARRDAEALRVSEREAGIREAAAERERARREIAAARDAALAEIYDQAVDLAAILSTKVLGRDITVEDHRRLLDEAMAQLQRATASTAV
jgi:F-type H+-transporting ATPase subunit b